MKEKGFGLILKAIDVSLDVRKLLTAVGGMAVTLGVMALLAFLGDRTGTAGSIFFGLLSIVAVWIGLSLTYGTIARMSYLHLARESSVSWQEAFGYAVDHWPALMFTGLALALGVVAVLIAEVILMLLGRIPYLGELIASLAFLPLTILNVFVLLVLFVGAWLMFPIIVAEGTGVVGTINRVITLVRRSPGQVAAYIALAIIAVAFASGVIFAVGYGAVLMTAGTTLAGAGQRFVQVIGSFFGPLFDFYSYPGLGFGPFLPHRVPFTITLAQLIYAIEFAGFVAVLAGFPAVFMMSAATATYISVAGEPPAEPESAIPVAPTPESGEAKAEPGTAGGQATEMRCANCGAAVQPGQRFCSECGAPV